MQHTMKQRRGLLVPILATLGLIAAIAGYLLLPSGYVAIDLNPSIEIKTNRLNQVVSVKGVNKDAQNLLKDYKLTDRDLDDVVEDLVDRMAKQGYLKESAKNDILITVNSSSASDQTLARVNKAIASYVKEQKLGARVLEQKLTIDSKLAAQAKQYGISAGRMAVIEKLFENKNVATVGELANMRIDDLMTYAQKNGISTKELEQALDDLDDLYEHDLFDRLEDQLDRVADPKEADKKPEWDAVWDQLWNDGKWQNNSQSWDQYLNGFLTDRHSDWDDIEDYLEKTYGGRWDELEDAMEAKYGDDWDDFLDDRYDDDNDDRDDWDDRYDDDRYDDDWDDRYDDDHDDDDDDWDDRYDDDDHDDDDDDDHDDDDD